MAGLAERAHRVIVLAIQVVLGVELVFLVRDQQWANVLLVLALLTITLTPLLLRSRVSLRIPPEFQLLAVIFVFAALFLGEVRSFYERYWWWDIALHASSGLLLGIVGFLLVYVLNESRNIDLQLRPGFVALFAFLFAVTVGTLWEILEFISDQTLGTNMQKPMRGDPSGLTDTMWDLIVDTLGALVISLFGWWYMSRDEDSFIEKWIRKFMEKNPSLFRD